ncbi:endonuclease III domain-containing protein [Candidatus Nanohalovita haloferacivicina]|uniref:endonuclease III domain-containing protein n=1 Tax=Candidatus Nanohalovita haloferacivicina TaxID=2978046 RepID=UPI00325FADF8|nr:Endonuclease III [Candidatus Nanohalobia archaeon BNXNv]
MDEEEKIRELNRRLKERYGEPPEPPELSAVDYLIETILSQNTNDINRDKAYKNLTEKYDTYEEIENGDYEELVDTIRIAGLGPTKAERIQESLRIVREDQGEYSLEFLRDMSVDDAKDWLTQIPGVGPKTAAIILCFYFRMPVFPVDTHVHRISKRLGLIPRNAGRKKAHNILEKKVPDDIKYELHRLMIEYGRDTASARNPDCENCIWPEECDYYQEVYKGSMDPEEF